MSIINERTKDDTKESEGFREQLRVRSEELAEQVLHQYFGYMITWIPQAEIKLEKNCSGWSRQGFYLKLLLLNMLLPL